MPPPFVPQGQRILVVDDEADVTELLKFKLSREGYAVETIEDPLEIMGKARDFRPHLFILDIMMPDLDGHKICRLIRADRALQSVPIIFLSARGQIEDRIRGLELGADDYLAKPFEIQELLLRIASLLRRTRDETAPSTERLETKGIVLDAAHHSVTVDDSAIDLTVTEFKLLRILMERKNRVQTRESLLVGVWDYDTSTETRTVDTHIRRLRDKLGPKASLIETVRGIGYRLNDH
ncbi:MAG: response regulator transcription factor [Opitutales bacterium]|nr:response regulator transcription factor [Opitutales bacterium]